MKHKVLLQLLRFLMYVKRFLWWFGPRLFFVFMVVFGPIYRFFSFLIYKLKYLFKRLGWTGGTNWWLKRDFLQVLLFISVVVIAFPQTKIFAQNNNYLAGQKTIAYALLSTDEEYILEEVVADTVVASTSTSPSSWRQGIVDGEGSYGMVSMNIYGSIQDQELSGVIVGGTVLGKPIISPGVNVATTRSQSVNYIVEAGDTLSGIAYHFGVSVATILWENNLTVRSVLKPGNKLVIPPTTGLYHTIKKGDNLNKIANLYDAKAEDVVKFNHLKEDGTDLKIGERIMIPDGVRPAERVVARAPLTTQSFNVVARPQSSTQMPSTRGFVWPSAARTITQYYGWSHHAIDVAGGGMGTPLYATKAGTVVISQCGWNGGYGITRVMSVVLLVFIYILKLLLMEIG
ncbi:MAG: Peptidase M23 [Candidatus Magasanikbacteria bacterium GW2011_GWA2_37_8]|uniref:Peptidase M23 n=1 Tax=Candidatus Magasanikbacteria bacterium GW2011_GWA2_37_8 TaxID=1619036 RepID=A0A0G0HCX1_9BACT|nr:MAG: Peptidase M23 [Candidatus Magasanikbacteria bacterium GW2011_GWA2_37_8]